MSFLQESSTALPERTLPSFFGMTRLHSIALIFRVRELEMSLSLQNILRNMVTMDMRTTYHKFILGWHFLWFINFKLWLNCSHQGVDFSVESCLDWIGHSRCRDTTIFLVVRFKGRWWSYTIPLIVGRALTLFLNKASSDITRVWYNFSYIHLRMYQARKSETRTMLDVIWSERGSRYWHNDICCGIGIVEWILRWFWMRCCDIVWLRITVWLSDILWCHNGSRLWCGRANTGVITLDQTRYVHRIVALNTVRNIGILLGPASPGLASLYMRNYRHVVGFAFLRHNTMYFLLTGSVRLFD